MIVTTIVDFRHDLHVTRPNKIKPVTGEELGESDMASVVIRQCYGRDCVDSIGGQPYLFVYARTDVDKVDHASYLPAATHIVHIFGGKCLDCGKKNQTLIQLDPEDYARCVSCDLQLQERYGGGAELKPHHLLAMSSNWDGTRNIQEEDVT